MDNVIADYQKWKLQGENLRVQARQAMEARYRELLLEAARVADEYRADFGSTLKPPPQITAFRYKAASKGKPKKPAAKPAAAAKVEAPAAKADPKVAALQKKLVGARKKLEDAKAAGGNTRLHEDRIYELEDALRLAMQ
jgi:hypothetical protein